MCAVCSMISCKLIGYIPLQVCTSEDSCRFARVSELFVYEKFYRVPADTVEAGDICAVCGIDDIQVHTHMHGSFDAKCESVG